MKTHYFVVDFKDFISGLGIMYPTGVMWLNLYVIQTFALQTPQAPIARTNKYNEYNMDEYPNGTNAVVAVLAHTGEMD